MLWSCNDDLFGVAIADGKHPCTAALTDDSAGLSMEAAVGHSLLDARLDNNVDTVTDLEPLDNRGYRREPALS
jgi:hypothetical protein